MSRFPWPGFSTLLRMTATSAVLLGLGKGLHVAMHIAFGRLLGAEGYGVVNFALSAVPIVAAVVGLGFQSSIVRFAAEYRARASWNLLRGVTRTSLLCVAGGSALAALALLAGWLATGGGRAADSLLLIAAFVVPTGLGLWRREMMRGLQLVAPALLPREVLLPLLCLLFLVPLPQPGVRQAALAYVLAMLVSEAIGTRWLLRGYPRAAKEVPPEARTRHWLKVSTTMLLGGISRMGLDRWDVLLLGAMLGMYAAGVYGAAARVALVVMLPLLIVNVAAAPRMTEAFHSRGPAAARGVMVQATAVAALMGGLAFCFVWLWPRALMGLFGSEFGEGTGLLRILAVGQLIKTVAGPAGAALSMTSHEGAYAVVTVSATVLQIAGLLVAIPRFGEVGVAWIVAGTSAFVSLTTLTLAWRRLSGGTA